MKSCNLSSFGGLDCAWDSSFLLRLMPTCENFLAALRIGTVANFCLFITAFRANTDTTGLGSKQRGGCVAIASCPSRMERSSDVHFCPFDA